MNMTPEIWYKSGSWLVTGKHRLFVQSIGQGKPILTLHAFPTSSYDYSRIAPLLAEYYQLIMFDYPGYGFSDKPQNHPYSLFECADLLTVVAAHFGIRRAYVLAHDIGDSIALIALLQHQLVIEKLILMNGSVVSIPFDDPVMRTTQRILLHRTLGPLIGRLGLINKTFFASTAKKLFSYPLPQQELDAFWSIISHNNGSWFYPVLMRYMVERWQYQYQWLDALKKYPIPLTLIWGQADPIATPAVAEAIRSYRPDATYVLLKGIGHYPHWETPETVAGLVKRSFE
jgi:pimeloyl-ACP methyl ester carboxylesterase